MPPSRTAPRLRRTLAAYTLDASGAPSAVCPRCWSRLDLDWGKGRGFNEREQRGWSVSRRVDDEAAAAAGEPLVAAIYRCANRDCATAVELHMRVLGGYVPVLVERHRLRDADAARFADGGHRADGVWVRAGGDARTAPPQRELF